MITDKNIIYEDDCLLVVDKPSGILTVPTPRKERHTLTNVLVAMVQQKEKGAGAYPCHRLDRETSGVILYAKTKPIQEKMMQQFKDGNVKKRYIAFVAGYLKKTAGMISFPLEGKKALTHYKLLQKRKGYSIIEVAPMTGRTNQIRIHFSMIGHPVIGEDKFAFRKDIAIKFRRVALHACMIGFRHPCRNEAMSFFSPLPDDMSRLAGWQIKEHMFH